jgi:hypothetical protein
MVTPALPDSSISHSKSMSRGKNEIHEEDPSIIVMNETQINDQPEDNQLMLDIIGERQGDSIGSSSVTESSESEEEIAEDYVISRN